MKKFIILTTSLALLTSCSSLSPTKVTNKEKSVSVKNALKKLHVASSRKNVRLDLRKSISIALRNNLEYRLQKVQAALANKQYKLAKTELFPNVDMTFAYDHRSRDYIKFLTDAAGQQGDQRSLIPHTIKTGTVLFNWNVLDFGLSYVRAQQAADRYMLALEQRKQMATRTINDVIKNYTLAYYGQELSKQVNELEKDIGKALKQSDAIIKQGIGDTRQQLEFKKTLIEDFRTAKDYLTYFMQSRDKLLNLINYNSKDRIENQRITFAKPDKYLVKLPKVNSHLLKLDTVSLFYRPELSEALYKVKETEKQKTIVVLEKLPSFGFNFGYNYDSDKYLLHQNWWSDNMSIAWNLINLATIPTARDAANTQLEAARLTHLASSAVVLGEIRVLLYNYKMKKYDFHLAEKESEYASKLYQHALSLSSSGLSDNQSLVKYKLTSLNSKLGKLKSFVDARNLFEDFIVALGLYGTQGEFVKGAAVDTRVITKWMNTFSTRDFDKLIKTYYSRVNNAYQLNKISPVHKKWSMFGTKGFFKSKNKQSVASTVKGNKLKNQKRASVNPGDKQKKEGIASRVASSVTGGLTKLLGNVI